MKESRFLESQKPVILVVDDKKNMLSLMRKTLQAEMHVLTALDGSRALEIIEQQEVDVVLSDLRLPDMDGLEILEGLKRLRPRAEFILMTAYASVGTAIQALRLGSYDYLTKPFDPKEARDVIKKAAGRAFVPGGGGGEGNEVLPGMLGCSEKMKELAGFIRRIAASSTTTLLLGETGTGKERVARALHQLSPRSGGRFVAVNCAAIPAELLESELFGFLKGSFSGADRDRRGLFEEADGGTLFLDEIGEMRLSLQAKLTRVLEERAVRRVGDSAERPIDFRLIAATHRDLKSLIEKGDFREDLWYRLNVASVTLPPLRERREDIELLAEHFLRTRSSSADHGIQGFEDQAMVLLRAYHWPGNVRQLKAVVERAEVFARGPLIEKGDLPADLLNTASKVSVDGSLIDLPWAEAMEKGRLVLGRSYLEGLLRQEGGNVLKAAKHAQVERESFYRLMRKFGVNK